MKNSFELTHKMLPELCLKLRFVLRRHRFEIKNVDQATNQLNVPVRLSLRNSSRLISPSNSSSAPWHFAQ